MTHFYDSPFPLAEWSQDILFSNLYADDQTIMTSLLLSPVIVSSLKYSFLPSDPYFTKNGLYLVLLLSSLLAQDSSWLIHPPRCYNAVNSTVSSISQVHPAHVWQREYWFVSRCQEEKPTASQTSLPMWEGKVNVYSNTGKVILVWVEFQSSGILYGEVL